MQEKCKEKLLERLGPLDKIEQLEDYERCHEVARLKKVLYTDCAALQGVYGDDENAPKPGLGPPVRRRPQHAHRRTSRSHPPAGPDSSARQTGATVCVCVGRRSC